LSQHGTRVERSDLRARVVTPGTAQGVVEQAPRNGRPRHSGRRRPTAHANSQDVPLGANALDHSTRFVASDGARCVLLESGFRDQAKFAPLAPIRCPARMNGPFTIIPGARVIGFRTVRGVVAERKMFDRMIDRGTSCVQTSGMPPRRRQASSGIYGNAGRKTKPCSASSSRFPTKERHRERRQLTASLCVAFLDPRAEHFRQRFGQGSQVAPAIHGKLRNWGRSGLKSRSQHTLLPPRSTDPVSVGRRRSRSPNAAAERPSSEARASHTR
jgi:hypothetical protein